MDILTKIRFIDPTENGRGYEVGMGREPHWVVSVHDLENDDEPLAELEAVRCRVFEQVPDALSSLNLNTEA